jgi:hyaluronoglucosaminidase
MRRKGLLVAVIVVAAAVTGVLVSGDDAAPRRATDVSVWPTPQMIERVGDDVALPASVTIEGGDASTRRVVEKALSGGTGDAGLKVRFLTDNALASEGYVLTVGPDEVSIASKDSAGAYFAAQTLRQLVRQDKIAAVKITDRPSMPQRGIVEGFYGRQWTYEEQQAQIDFAASVKFNSYVYAPKGDPQHRDRWREPYSAERLAQLGDLAKRAADAHIEFTYSLAPGLSICYSNPEDRDAIDAKFAQLHGAGVRSFALLLDDIDYKKWNCQEDQETFGAPGPENAARAQTDLLNDVQLTLKNEKPDVGPLVTVLTEYGDVNSTQYKQTFREDLDGSVEVMWTGTAVVPKAITKAESVRAEQLWGRETLVWDNYPVADYPDAAGRLLLGSYSGREPGLRIQGLLSNPMSQAYASRVAMFEMADYAWNDAAYDPDKAERAYAEQLAGGDERVTEALLAFFDLNSWTTPRLVEQIDTFQERWTAGDRKGAISGLRGYADVLAGAPKLIRDGVAEKGFATDSAPWLDACERSGKALQAALAGLDGDRDRFSESSELVQQTGKTVRMGDGTLDTFLARAPNL